EFAVVPFETSTEGPLQSTILALMNRDLRISEILEDAFDLHLMARAVSLVDAREVGHDAPAPPPVILGKVYATAADHALCGRFLETLVPRVSGVHVNNESM